MVSVGSWVLPFIQRHILEAIGATPNQAWASRGCKHAIVLFPVHCPDWRDGDPPKMMRERFGGVWFKCNRCGHIVIAGEKHFKCFCLNCIGLHRSHSN
jgi:hypothetical protein